MSTTTAATPTNRNAEPVAQQPAAASPPDSTPAPEAPAQRDRPDSRCFSMDGVAWTAWVSGTGAAGTGACGLGLFEAIHFAPAANGDQRQRREALIARGRFSNLFDEELLALFRTATPLPDSPPPAQNGRRNGRRR